MYSGGSVVYKASTIGIDISPIPPLIFTGGKKCENCHCFQHHSSLSRPHLKMQQDIRTLKQSSCAIMAALCLRHSSSLVMLDPRTPENCWLGRNSPKIALRKRAKSSITQRCIIRFRWNFAQSLNTWQSKNRESSRSKGQRSRSQHDIKEKEIAKSSIIQPKIARFDSNVVHVMLDVPQTFKVNGSKVNVTAWHNVSASKKTP